MPDLVVVGAAVAAGMCSFCVVLATARAVASSPAGGLQLAPGFRLRQVAGMRGRLALEIERAGWPDTPERVLVLTCVAAGAAGALGLAAGAVLAPATAGSLGLVAAVAGGGAVVFSLHSAVGRRRIRLTRELAPLLELFVLELAGGGSALAALGSVTLQLEGELASELRRLLIASQVSGTASFEARLRDYSDRLQVPALSSLATILTASREYGTGVTQGVRAVAADLRRHQRRELIAHSRRALNHVLFPAAIGVLLPFLAILLFPAVSALQGNLR